MVSIDGKQWFAQYTLGAYQTKMMPYRRSGGIHDENIKIVITVIGVRYSECLCTNEFIAGCTQGDSKQ